MYRAFEGSHGQDSRVSINSPFHTRSPSNRWVRYCDESLWKLMHGQSILFMYVLFTRRCPMQPEWNFPRQLCQRAWPSGRSLRKSCSCWGRTRWNELHQEARARVTGKYCMHAYVYIPYYYNAIFLCAEFSFSRIARRKELIDQLPDYFPILQENLALWLMSR